MAGGSTCSGPLTSMGSLHPLSPAAVTQPVACAWNLVSLLSAMALTTYFLLSGKLLPP